jgi:hypothetical protein
MLKVVDGAAAGFKDTLLRCQVKWDDADKQVPRDLCINQNMLPCWITEFIEDSHERW